MEDSDVEVISLFEVVVSTNRLLLSGSRSMICCLRVPIDAAGDMGKTSVGGRPKPGKDVKSTLIG